MPSPHCAPFWQISPGVCLTLDQPRLLGILNATPDSFSDGGRHDSAEALIGFGLRLAEEGAAILDVGGESTRPGAPRVPAAEQIRRTVPVIRQLRMLLDLPISIDTTSAEVAEAALDAGASIINDISAGRDDPQVLDLAARRRCGLILMHRRAPSSGESYSHEYAARPHYEDLVEMVRSHLIERAAAAEKSGCARHAIVIDPGLGFGKDVDQNFELIRRTEVFTSAPYPVLGAASRKSFIGAATGVGAPASRAIGSAAASVAQYLLGVRLFRVHDVAVHREALAVASAVVAGGLASVHSAL